LLLVAVFSPGCHVVQSTAKLPARAVNSVTPGQTGKQKMGPVDVQQTLQRFADGFSAQMVAAADQLQSGTNTLDARDLLRIKIGFTTETTSIAASPNAFANLIDMAAFVTVTRMALEDHWVPNVFGDSARPMLVSCQNAETNVWQLVSQAFSNDQQVQLRDAIQTWRAKNPISDRMLGARTLELSKEIFKKNKPEAGGGGGNVLGLLMLDPLAGMDPAVREIAQTRLFAERALYVAQKMPLMLRWQTELLSINATETPAVQQLVSNSTAISASLERFATVAEKLPNQVSSEREEILKALHSQEKDLAALMNAGTDMSDSLNTTLTTFDALMKRFGVGETNNTKSSATNAEPFRIQDYTATAAQLSATADRLTELLSTLDRTLGSTNIAALTEKVSPAVERAEAGGKAVVDYAFWKGVLLVGIGLLAMLIYQFATARLKPPLRN
jgi:hypothetical protein